MVEALANLQELGYEGAATTERMQTILRGINQALELPLNAGPGMENVKPKETRELEQKNNNGGV